ncbi:MAG: NAD(P)(+) transhydrogenase (Re/Si-specific) subunit beta [Spirochaetales bacterium]|nr:NAD(P)(+) transhydrogenase (Re/Si-specific) subunit beta [Leptospiraceae bacterium]MCP5483125.1 NAD(P)(+) transhydrogenase (Re/Si-specific) subunit beta [Spirochaetales bacterium]MCP5484565.1 NAD(P)(+) transhydrogenase (Re/Si-specific) subunit beta [Spirochaetales bacterium]
MIEQIKDIAYLVSSVLFIFGIKQLGAVRTARQGNFLAALGMFIAVAVTLFQELSYELIIAGIMIGSLIGVVLALRIQMTGMPQMVALLNGFGGIGSLLVASAEYIKDPLMGPETGVTVVLSVLIGGVTFTGSLVAFGKLQGIVTEKSVMFPGQHLLNLILILIGVALGVLLNIDGFTLGSWFNAMSMDAPSGMALISTVIGLSLLLGVLLVIPIGGADMPVVISLLNSYSGIAAATTGFVLGNKVLIITGALVGASGIILTQIMCKSMNRSLMNVLLGGFGTTTGVAKASGDGPEIVVKKVEVEETAMLFDSASSVIIVPGYGMAVAQAQHVVRELMEVLQKRGCTVRFAIHPVAGRMPGHMNVLLAEANVPYEQLFEMDQINDDFANTDLALVIGANDVTNPAARHDQSSPIFGMPILNVDKAGTVVVVKRSLKPGYAGIDNELYGYPNCLMYLGDAKDAIAKLIAEIKANA